MTMTNGKVSLVGLCVIIALFVAAPIQGKEDKTKLTGAEIQELLCKPGAINFGINHMTNSVFITEVLENGKRILYWRSLQNSMIWGTDIGTAEVVGDKMCSKWTFSPQKCFDIYRVGENKYESYLGENLVAAWYSGQEGYETKKDKVKLTGDALKKLSSQYAVWAGVNKLFNNVWIIIYRDGGKRELYWQSLAKPGVSGSWLGTAQIVGDQRCLKWTFGQKKCYDVYRAGEDQYESWYGGMMESFYYRLK
jgi:hypothetical protein